MSHPKCRDSDSIDFLIATPRTASGCEAARSQPPAHDPPAHDAYTRLLQRREPDPETLSREAEPRVDKDDGVLVVDDSTLAERMEPVPDEREEDREEPLGAVSLKEFQGDHSVA
jgi:hypothetical protein